MRAISPVSFIFVFLDGRRDMKYRLTFHSMTFLTFAPPAIQLQLETRLILMPCSGRVPWFTRFGKEKWYPHFIPPPSERPTRSHRAVSQKHQGLNKRWGYASLRCRYTNTPFLNLRNRPKPTPGHEPFDSQSWSGLGRLGIEELIETRRERIEVVQPRSRARLLKNFP